MTRARRRPTRSILLGIGLGLALTLALTLGPTPPLHAAPPADADAEPEPEPEPETDAEPPSGTATLRGRVREHGPARAPVSGAVIMLVDAPEDVRPGRPADVPLAPEDVTWMFRAETDAEGRFAIPEVPVGKLRIVIVAGGYARVEQWAELRPGGTALELRVEPEGDTAYRTEVATDRRRSPALERRPEHQLDAQEIRHYPGSGDDPMLAALNLPGVARSPGGLGMLALRGGDPSQVGVYVDGHPVPRAFHVIPIAAVVSPPLVDRISLEPGNYAVAYGGFGGGLATIDSRAGRREGVHGQAHVDLFDLGATLEGPVGDGSVHFGLRRSHAGDILGLIDLPQQLGPNFWDYLGRFDHPIGRGHSLGVRALGAGDRLLLADYFDFRASFHRFDLDYRYRSRRWEILVTPSLRLDRSSLDTLSDLERQARVYSVRAGFRWQPLDTLALDFGADVVVESWRRRQQTVEESETDDGQTVLTYTGYETSRGDQLRFGAWLAAPLHPGDFSLIPAVRLNVFAYGDRPRLRVDPRVTLRGPLSRPVRLTLGFGMYGIPVVGAREQDSTGYIAQGGEWGEGVADVPEYLLAYFDPNIDGEVIGRWVSSTYVLQASTGLTADLPWRLELSALGFWRLTLPTRFGDSDVTTAADQPDDLGRRRASGLELLLRRSLVRDVVDGWIGYTLLWSRVENQPNDWEPALFDQRHNLVALISLALPRGYRVGARFRLASGNPERPVTGRETVQDPSGVFTYRPIRGPLGTSYQPMFHQLDVRIDKRWILDRVAVNAYLDVQNVYNHTYPEVYIYSLDWSYRQGAIGLPIYPSLGVSVDY